MCFRSSAGEPLGSFRFGAAVRNAAVNGHGQASVGFPSEWGWPVGGPVLTVWELRPVPPPRAALTVFYCSDRCLLRCRPEQEGGSCRSGLCFLPQSNADPFSGAVFLGEGLPTPLPAPAFAVAPQRGSPGLQRLCLPSVCPQLPSLVTDPL